MYDATVQSYPGAVWLVFVLYLVMAQAALYWAYVLAQRDKEGRGGDGGGGLGQLLLKVDNDDEEAGAL